MTRLAFSVAGVPVQQGSKTVFHGRAVDQNQKKLRPWRSTVRGIAATAMQVQGVDTFDDAVKVGIWFEMPAPKTVRRPWPSVKPDLDKLVRAILDALTDARVFSDDSRVVSLDVIETYGARPAAHVVVDAIHPNALAMWRARNER